MHDLIESNNGKVQFIDSVEGLKNIANIILTQNLVIGIDLEYHLEETGH